MLPKWRTSETSPPEGQRCWDGRRWTVVASPTLQLESVAASSADDVWAVGTSFTPHPQSADTARPLIEHWDGRTWRLVASADLGETDGVLSGVDAISPDQAWAVGSNGYTPLIEEWDGRTWRKVPHPDFDADTRLVDVAATSPTNAWAVGYIAAVPLIEHSDGQSWHVVRVPSSHLRRWSEHKINTGVFAVATTGPDDVWMTGFRIEHWNGLRFQAGPVNGGGSGLVALSRMDVWEVGSIARGLVRAGHRPRYRTRILRYSCR